MTIKRLLTVLGNGARPKLLLMTNRKSVGAKINDLAWSWTADTHCRKGAAPLLWNKHPLFSWSALHISRIHHIALLYPHPLIPDLLSTYLTVSVAWNNCFRKIFNTCWRESVKPLLFSANVYHWLTSFQGRGSHGANGAIAPPTYTLWRHCLSSAPPSLRPNVTFYKFLKCFYTY